MERKGGCCLAARYGAAGGGGQGGMAWQMGKIMLKFRPIAPKPAAMAPAPSPAPVTAVGAAGKRKRKGAGGCGGGKRGRKTKKAGTVATAAPAAGTVAKVPAEKEKEKEKSSSSSSSSGMTSVDSPPPPPPPATLPLMPVSPVEKTKVAAATLEPRPPVAPAHAAGQPVALLPAASLVTVEDVTSTWRDGEPAPSSAAFAGDDDDAPAFVSDQWGRVTWTNAAFSRAVESSHAPAGADAVRVCLAAKGGAAVPAWGTCAGFTCRARVQYACPRRGGSSLVAPCDVWRLDAGGYLWRLDLQAALSLSLGALP